MTAIDIVSISKKKYGMAIIRRVRKNKNPHISEFNDSIFFFFFGGGGGRG